jgi:lactoylglutathione lyase
MKREKNGSRRELPERQGADRRRIEPMKIEHTALWVSDLERTRAFYETFFGAVAGLKYTNAAKGFESYFLAFPSGGARLELMRRAGLPARPAGPEHTGWAHLAVSVGSAEAVDLLTERLRSGGYEVIDGPRRTGDGYYESVVLDPEGNRVEITA